MAKYSGFVYQPCGHGCGGKVVELRYLDVTGEKASQKSKWRGAQQDMLVPVLQASRKSGYRWENRS
jgi:hypothetical protein